ncbi:MAG: hypothetical protein ACPGVB_13720 [Chitinophagales bacterium]
MSNELSDSVKAGLTRKDTLQCGGYDAFIPNFGTVQHAYSRINNQWYNCFGGHNGPNDKWPMDLWYKKSNWSFLRNSKKTSTNDASEAWSNRIAGWSMNPTPTKILASHAGLTYLISGVCHQACNSVMYSSGDSNWTYGYINNVSGMTVTWAIYGYYGSPSDSLRIMQFDSFARGLSSDSLSEEEELQKGVLSELQTLQQGLDAFTSGQYSNPTKESKDIATHFQVGENDGRIQPFMQGMNDLMKQKADYDKNLLLGKFSSPEEVATAYNKLFQEVNKLTLPFTKPHLSTEDLELRHVEAGQIADPTFIHLDVYKRLGEQLKF